MIKRFFLAALAAVALTMGFTACSEEDENGPVEDGYSLTVNVHADVMGSDLQEFAVIYNAYRSAFGLEELTEKTGDEATESVVITGKDSLDCVSAILKKCAQAEAAVQGTNWSDVNVISVRDASTNAEIYTKQYGAPAENGYDHAKFDRLVGSLYQKESVPDDFCVNRLWIDSRSTTIGLGSEFWWNAYVGTDLNCRAGGNYVYPSYFACPYGSGNEGTNYVGGLLVLNNESGSNPPEELTFEDIKYKITKDYNTESYYFDLNHKAGGNYLYLYQAGSLDTQKVLEAGPSQIYWAKYDITMEDCNPRDENDRFVRGVTLYRDGSLVLTHPNGIDLNLNAGGYYMYWREVYRPRY